MKVPKVIFEVWRDGESISMLLENNTHARHTLPAGAVMVDRIEANDGGQAAEIVERKYYGDPQGGRVKPEDAVKLLQGLPGAGVDAQKARLSELAEFFAECPSCGREAGSAMARELCEMLAAGKIRVASRFLAFYALGKAVHFDVGSRFMEVFLQNHQGVRDTNTAEDALRALENFLDADINEDLIKTPEVVSGFELFFRDASRYWLNCYPGLFNRIVLKVTGRITTAGWPTD